MSHERPQLPSTDFAAELAELSGARQVEIERLQQRVLAECDARVREIQAQAAAQSEDRLAPVLQLISVAREAAALRSGSPGPAHDVTTLAGIELTYDALADLAHKINNPLTSLLGRAQILQMKKDMDPQVLKASQVIEESAKRIAEHIRELNQLIRASRESLRPAVALTAPAGTDGGS